MSEAARQILELQTMTVDVRPDEHPLDDPGTIRAEFSWGDCYVEVSLPLHGRLLELVSDLEAAVRELAREGLKQ